MSDKTEQKTMLGAAVSFYNSAEILTAISQSTMDNGDLSKKLLPNMISAIVLYALSIEVGIKALLTANDIEIPRQHDLKRLFEKLPDEVQKGIKKSVSSAEFDKLLSENKDVFMSWRYFYETDLSANIGFLKNLASAIISVGKTEISD